MYLKKLCGSRGVVVKQFHNLDATCCNPSEMNYSRGMLNDLLRARTTLCDFSVYAVASCTRLLACLLNLKSPTSCSSCMGQKLLPVILGSVSFSLNLWQVAVRSLFGFRVYSCIAGHDWADSQQQSCTMSSCTACVGLCKVVGV